MDKYHTPEQRERSKGTDAYLLAVRINDTLDALEEEQQLLAFNFVSCGAILEQFVCSLTRVMQWDPVLKSEMRSNPSIYADHRQGAVLMFAQHLLGALDFSSHPMDHMFLNVPLGDASSHFLTVFFTSLDPEKTSWFQRIGYV